MIEQVNDFVEHAFFRRVAEQAASTEEKKGQMSFMLSMDNVSVSNEQIGKLLEILHHAAAEANAVMGWQQK